MPAKPIPYGVADYNTIIKDECAYVDKTMYIRSLEQAGYFILFLRPRRFGKSLFASTLGYYYDIYSQLAQFIKYNVLYIHNALPSNGFQIMICTYFAGNEEKHLRHGTYFIIRNNGGDQYSTER